MEIYVDGTVQPVCFTTANTFWSKTFFLVTIGVMFALPLAMLVILYSVIAVNLMTSPIIVPITRTDATSAGARYRKQVVVMIGTVVLFFFVCLLPFRALVVWIVIVPHEEVSSLGNDLYYMLLFGSRLMFYVNSAVNPILYNLMSSKFRTGFLKVCGLKKNCLQKHTRALLRNSTFTNSRSTTTGTAITNNSSSVIVHRPSSKFSLKFNLSSTKRQTRCQRFRKKPVRRRRSFSDFWSGRKTSQNLLSNRSHSFDTIFKSDCFLTTNNKKSNIKFIIKSESNGNFYQLVPISTFYGNGKQSELKESFV